jgi:Amt family ammonium transporter
MTGGVAALVGAAIIGPRSGRFEGGGRVGKPVPIKGHSSVLQVMGTFILWLGWYGFNPGSTLGITPSGYAMHASRSVVTTTLSAATGGVVVVILDKFLGSKTWDVGAVCNGILGGLVSITAGCSTVYPWASVLIGFIGGGVYFGSSKLVLNVCKVDDPLDAFAVHGACGFWGCLATAFLAAPAYAYGGTGVDDCSEPYKGAFYGGDCLIGVAMAALIAEIAWVGGMSFIMFFALKMSGLLRVSQDIEEMGMDVSKHGGTAYEMEGAAAKAAATSS